MAGVRVRRPGEITRQLLDNLTLARTPAIIDIRIDREVRIEGGGRNEALQHMSMLSEKS